MSYRKSLAAVAAAALVAGGGLLASAGSAEAQWRRGWGGGPGVARVAPGPRYWGGGPRWRGYGYRRGWGGGGAVAAGVIGGLALGAIAASAAPAYGAPLYYDGYYPSRGLIPAYGGGYAPAYYGYSAAPVSCWWQRQRVPVDAWTYEVRRVRVCR